MSKLKDFTVVFISNVWAGEDDSCDHKEWKTVTAETSAAACKEIGKNAIIVRCTED